MSHSWCDSALLRRTQIESGKDLTFNEVFKPFFVGRITGLSPKSILEVGAGTGHIAKELSHAGFSVTAIEPSKGMFDVAREVLEGSSARLLNCSSFDLKVGDLYDFSFSHLVAHVVDDVFAFFQSVNLHLIKGGAFLFSIPHPCFFNDYKKLFGDEYNYMSLMSKNITFTITKDSENAISGVPYHHRPLSEYINRLIESGFVIDSFEEIYPDDETQARYGAKWECPRYCVFSCKKL